MSIISNSKFIEHLLKKLKVHKLQLAHRIFKMAIVSITSILAYPTFTPWTPYSVNIYLYQQEFAEMKVYFLLYPGSSSSRGISPPLPKSEYWLTRNDWSDLSNNFESLEKDKFHEKDYL